METWQFGAVPLALGVGFVVLVILLIAAKAFGDYVLGREVRLPRVRWLCGIVFAVGFVFGGYLQPPWQRTLACHQAGAGSWLACAFRAA